MNKAQVLALMTDDVETRRGLIHDFITNEENSFEDRKEVWLATPEHLYTTNNYVIHLPDFESKHGEISWYDDFYAEKDSVVNLRSPVEDALDEEGVFMPGFSDFLDTEEKMNDFIAACMKAGYHSFTYDW